MKAPAPKLAAGVVYLGDNGRAICIHCAGQSARYTGDDLSGQPVVAVVGDTLVEWLKMTGAKHAYCECERTKSLPLDEPFNIFTARNVMIQYQKATGDDRYGASVNNGKMRLEILTKKRGGAYDVKPCSEWVPVGQWIGFLRNLLLEATKP